MDYIRNLRQKVEEQVVDFIIDVMHPDYSSEKYVQEQVLILTNRLAQTSDQQERDGIQRQLDKYNSWDAAYQARRSVLSNKTATQKTSFDANETTKFVKSMSDPDGVEENNNPKYPSNLIDRYNTPFDHIERIILQDFSTVLGGQGTENYFRMLFKQEDGKKGISFRTDDRFGVKHIGMSDNSSSSVANYDVVNHSALFNNSSDGTTDFDSTREFFIDSFTYTPYVDYSQYVSGDGLKEKGRGIYADEYLTKFNQGIYDDKTNIESAAQVDANRRDITTRLYELNNLEDDIYQAKIDFRDAVANQDGKTYIHTFCEHLFTLFAKLSNIRMSHVFYGFKSPHTQWEGILALDIWYNKLYKDIDLGYPFDERYLDRNPMVKLRKLGDKVSYLGTEYSLDVKLSDRDVTEHTGVEVFKDGPGTTDEYALLWDNALYNTFQMNAEKISDERRNCVLPRGVLGKIHTFVKSDISRSLKPSIVDHSSGDFSWFEQSGKVYSDSDKSRFSKYTNLHLCRAYDVMTPSEYQEVVGDAGKVWNEYDGSGKLVSYGKPPRTKFSRSENLSEYAKFLSRGCDALADAFSVIKNEKLFNIYNSNTRTVEEFNPDNARYYSQSQCAIVIERVFSRLYKYLQFKSTTEETFQKHINIDSGYKYLTTESVLDSANPNSSAYYDDDGTHGGGETKYMSYVKKLAEYLLDEGEKKDILDSDEKEVLGNAISVLEYYSEDWKEHVWNLCPLLTELGKNENEPRYVGRKFLSRESTPTQSSSTQKTLLVYYGLNSFVSCQAPDSNKLPSGATVSVDASGKPISLRYDGVGDFSFDLSSIAVKPTFTSPTSGKSVEYELMGYSTTEGSSQCDFSKDSVLVAENFTSINSNIIRLYAVWKAKYIVEFRPGIGVVSGEMQAFVVEENTTRRLGTCTYRNETLVRPKCVYYKSNTGYWKEVETNSSETKSIYGFDQWQYTSNGITLSVQDAGYITLPSQEKNMYPVLVLTAKWRVLWKSIGFWVGSEKYCDVLIDASSNALEYPETQPILTDSDKTFIGWDSVSGEILTSNNPVNIVCQGDETQATIYCNPPSDTTITQFPIICHDTEVIEYDKKVSARLADIGLAKFTITYKYISESGITITKTVDATENEKVPSFHIHDSVEVVSDSRKHVRVFRYWKLESGNLSSSLTLLSPVVFTAIYDEVSTDAQSDEDVVDETSTVLVPEVQRHHDEHRCIGNHIGHWTDESGTKHYYCKFTGISPRRLSPKLDGQGNVIIDQNTGKPVMMVNYDETKVNVSCPLVQSLQRNYHEKNDFSQITILEIGDISKLLSALLKVNIDIAHREYFLKVAIPNDTDWWYGYTTTKVEEQVICQESTSSNYSEDGIVICQQADEQDMVVCENIGCVKNTLWYSFEPTVEYKFSNLHASNQLENGKLICTKTQTFNPSPIVPVNRELQSDTQAIHYNDALYCYDYITRLNSILGIRRKSSSVEYQVYDPSDSQKYYAIKPLCLYENLTMQSPTDVNDFVRHRLGQIERTNRQVQTFTSIVKKYRPIIVPSVRDIFNDCINESTKYEVDKANDYGVFGWCTIPSKTMVNMEYNEQSIVVPSSYDHYNRVAGQNFLQMDKDFANIYRYWDSSANGGSGKVRSNIKDTWYYLYNQRDWTYFLQPFFGIKPNNEVYSFMLDEFKSSSSDRPVNSNHLNSVIFEQLNFGGTEDRLGRNAQSNFDQIFYTCDFLAKYHHNENNLRILSEHHTNLISYSKLKELTCETQGAGIGKVNSLYGSRYDDLPESFRYCSDDWVDDYDKTSSYLVNPSDKENDSVASGTEEYRYCLGQRHAIDDYDDGSVWFYITMTRPLDDLNQVVELQDIMPFVFWWSNRGSENNGPTVDCYGRMSNAKLNYEIGGYCYESPIGKPKSEDWISSANGDDSDGLASEQRWHAVQHTFGTDFSKPEYGGTILTQDNSGNCYRGAYDPLQIGTDAKWKIHDTSSAFGTPQHSDPIADKYNLPLEAHGDETLLSKISQELNQPVVDSVEGKPMTWNLWNVVRHYVYIRDFKNRQKALSSDAADWDAIEYNTKKIVKGIYRTFQQKKMLGSGRASFGDIDGSSTNLGGDCLVNWTNSFIEVTSLLERNAREHSASLVLFTGNNNYSYDEVRKSVDNFRITTLDGVDDDSDGMRPRKKNDTETKPYIGYVSEREYPESRYPADKFKISVFQGRKYSDLPPSYVIGDSTTYQQIYSDVDVDIGKTLNLDQEYPESEFHLGQTTQKWIRQVTNTVLNRQVIPVYTSMENMTVSHHDISDEELKGITFQIVPQMYWRYDWSSNEFMIHRVGKLNSPSNDLGLTLYDLLGNVWEWVRDDWYDWDSTKISELNGKTNPIVDVGSDKKVIRGGAFDSFARSTISSSREGVSTSECMSNTATQANIGFRPSMTFTIESESGGFTPGTDPVELFFLFDASVSQNNQISQMLESAKQIVKQFAGDIRGNANNTKAKNLCHVGSALYLGPSIRFMCCKQHEPEWSKSGQKWGKAYCVKTQRTYLGSNGPEMTGYEYIRKPADSYNPIPEDIEDYKNDSRYKSDSLSGLKDYYQKEFLEYRQSWWNSPDGSFSAKSIDGAQLDVPMLMTSRDGDGGGVGGGTSSSHGEFVSSSPYNGPWYSKYELTWKSNQHNMYVYSGVPAWWDSKSEDKSVHFEDDDSSTYDFFTYDPTKAGIDSFECPFVWSEKGTLSNWWSGCEPTSYMLSKLLNDGFFFDEPYNDALGYMFRNTDIPRLVFIFTNEFDNSRTRSYTFSKGTIDKQVLTYPEFNRNGNIIQSYFVNPNGDGFEPFDPLCLQMVKEWDGISKFVNTIGIGSNEEVKSSNAAVGFLSSWCKSSDISLANVSTALVNSLDTMNKVDGFNPTQDFLDAVSSGASYPITYDVPKTAGFYRLRNTIKNLAYPMNAYLMVSDANAPRLLDDLGITFSDDGSKVLWMDIKEEVKATDANAKIFAQSIGYDVGDISGVKQFVDSSGNKVDILDATTDAVRKSICLAKNEELWVRANQQQGEIPLSTMTKCGYTWAQILDANEEWWNNQPFRAIDMKDSSITYNDVNTILGLENPYKTTKIVFGVRELPTYINDYYQYVIIASDLVMQQEDKIKDYLNSKFAQAGAEAWVKSHVFSLNDGENPLGVSLFDEKIRNGIQDNLDMLLCSPVFEESTDNAYGWSCTQCKTYKKNSVKFLYSSESFTPYVGGKDYSSVSPKQSHSFGATRFSYIFGSDVKVTDIVTINYAGGGILKVVNLNKSFITAPSENDTIIYASDFRKINLNYKIDSQTISSSDKIKTVLNNTSGVNMPDIWLSWIKNLNYTQTSSGTLNALLTKEKLGSENSLRDLYGQNVNEARKVLKFILETYHSLKLAMPLMMSYRWYSQNFSKLDNKDGKFVTDYKDTENNVVIKPLPIMNFKDMHNLFKTSFGSGQFSASKKFRYTQCVVDLNPNSDEYDGLEPGSFPMSFMAGIDVNTDDYKTSKLVLSKVESISGDQHATFTMGSSDQDYVEISDPLELKYADESAITNASKEHTAEVTLTNGGSYQKNGHAKNEAEDPSYTEDSGFYGLKWKDNTEINTYYDDSVTKPAVGDYKYFKNKHFFIDPFALTIAQWCYIRGWNTEESARTGLGDKLAEISSSYWKYLATYEPEDWKAVRTLAKKNSNYDIPDNADDEDIILALSADESAYNPLKDTRPYYYASYDEVRGRRELYSVKPNNVSDTAKNYVYDSEKYDELQNVSFRDAITITDTTPILDILNKKVSFNTRKRIYSTDTTDGGKILNVKEMSIQERNNGNLEVGDKQWCYGESAGINFDLPTEAQWEYCVRAGGQFRKAFPNDNLGGIYETRSEGLDLISWYRYKVIGSLPEPERFCAWRVSKMLFGICKDQEAVNNVYETMPD